MSWGITEWNGYVPKTTFWEDFSIADQFGEEAVEDTYERAMRSWSGDCVFLTELVLVLNHKIWQHYEKNPKLAAEYDKCWRLAETYALEHMSKEELKYYFEVTD